MTAAPVSVDMEAVHLGVRTKLELLQSAIVPQGLDAADAGKRFGELMEGYAADLPVEARGN